MTHFRSTGGGFGVAPGIYAVVAQDSYGSVPNPGDETGQPGKLLLPTVDVPTLARAGSLETLVLPVGRDRAGCRGRSIALGGQTLVVFDCLAIMPLDRIQAGFHVRAGHIGRIATVIVKGPADGIVRPADGGYEMTGFRPGVEWIDTDTPGAFTIEGETFDMAHAETAAIFGYGTEAFNAALDDYGFQCDVRTLRERLTGRTDPEAVAVRNRLPECDTATARYAPVIP
ncbi:MAG: hypothetical protein KF730_12590 [Sphingomonas sp.]|uniref:hypothetical protein n=1 Tax=Sphingomonas sp. TaxID=28214 RepID=UPI0025E3F792|nr:hypothetical protein [Sphingomonas sp.]MBX3565399.1 hypothetical protein [Sphingomonas sp.]